MNWLIDQWRRYWEGLEHKQRWKGYSYVWAEWGVSDRQIEDIEEELDTLPITQVIKGQTQRAYSPFLEGAYDALRDVKHYAEVMRGFRQATENALVQSQGPL